MTFRLKELREARHLSQVRLAMELNLSQNSISRYENREREAGYETLVAWRIIFRSRWTICWGGRTSRI